MCPRPMVCFLELVSYLVLGLGHLPVACVITTSAVSSLPCFWEFHLFPFFFLGILLCSVVFVYLFIHLYLLIFALLPCTKRNTIILYVLSVCTTLYVLSVCTTISNVKHLTNFSQLSREGYGFRGHLSLILFIYAQTVTRKWLASSP